VAVLMRGDRDVNEAKLAKLIQAPPIPASDEKIRSLGAEPGFASPMGVDTSKCRLIVDHTVAGSNNLVTGANEVDYHYKNFNLERDCPGVETIDIVEVQEGDGCTTCDSKLTFKRGIEVGNIFQLGTTYTEAMGMEYLDDKSETCIPIMGCYGIGVGRLMSSVMEVRHDKFGPKWPISIAPWQVHLNALKITGGGVKETADTLYEGLQAAGLEVLYDDRDARPGVQFADADLLGIPFRIIVGERNLKEGNLEWKRRDTGESGTIPVEGAVETIKGWVADALAELDKVADAK
ncbi:MAG: proline--tRNA ligase, partial [bacterium]|nr:proline--tRNA ligase [bacterium]